MAEKDPGGSKDALHGSPETPDPNPTRWRAQRSSGAFSSQRDAAWTWKEGRAGASLCFCRCRRYCGHFLICKKLCAPETSSRIGPRRQQRVFALIPSPQARADTKPRGRHEKEEASHEGVHQGAHTFFFFFFNFFPLTFLSNSQFAVSIRLPITQKRKGRPFTCLCVSLGKCGCKATCVSNVTNWIIGSASGCMQERKWYTCTRREGRKPEAHRRAR